MIRKSVGALLGFSMAAIMALPTAAAPPSAQVAEPPFPSPASIQAMLDDRVGKGRAVGIVLATYRVGHQPRIYTSGTTGRAGLPLDGNTLFEIGSITKTFTATLLAREVLAGRLTLETPVARLLDGFTVPSRNGKEITLGSIATQHSGLPRLPTNMAPADPDNPYADYDAAKLKAFLADYQLPRDPGASYEYSNLGFGLLGYALAQSQHGSYAALVGDGIFKPLGMTMTGLAFTDVMRAHLAPGHDDNGKPAKNWDIDALAGAGAIRSTANDHVALSEGEYGCRSVAAGRGDDNRASAAPRHEQEHAHRPCLDDHPSGNCLAQWRHRRLSQLSRL